ncbi:MAG: ATP-dependent protease ATPase subunit HslU [Clostridia bacterium]
MEYTPIEIVQELSKNIIGQDDAKRAVAVALRNRYRRSLLSDDIKAEITPKNIIMKGPTGVGKTEIARRLAKLVKAPFVKVEATKFTEVGYVGRDVESMVKDLVDASIRLVKEENFARIEVKARESAEKKIAAAIAKSKVKNSPEVDMDQMTGDCLADLRNGVYDDLMIDIEVNEQAKPVEVMSGMGAGMEIDFGNMFGGMFGKNKKRKKASVKDAVNIVTNEEADKLIDNDAVNAEAIRRAENEGIIFIDEIDKICGGGGGQGPNVSREGVQRDILPIIEGTTVTTKYGVIKTDYILFIAAGAFHVSKFTDLIPELQGRFPISVELKSLTKDDYFNILTNTESSVIMQYKTLLAVDNVNLIFKEDALMEIAEVALEVNSTSEDIGARRLHTIMENIIEEISFNACGNHPMTDVVVDKAYVQNHLTKDMKLQDLTKYII